MKNVFVIKDTTIVAPEPYLLPVDKISELLDKITANMAPEDVFHQTLIPLNVINAVIKDIVEIKSTAIRLMNGESVNAPEERDELGEVVQGIVYNIIPTDQTEFMISMGDIIANGFVEKAQLVYAIQSPEDLNPFIGQVLTNLIKYCNGTNTATWNDFIQVTQE